MTFPEGALDVLTGDITLGAWGFADDFMLKGQEEISLNDLRSCRLVSDRHESYQTGTGRVAGGIIGGVLLGPLGAAAGLLAGGKRRIDETIILCRLADGRAFTAQCSQLTAAKFSEFAEANQFSTKRLIENTVAHSLPTETSVGATVECPMCAETIKARALICRYCGYKIAEELEKRVQKATADSNTEEVLSYSELFDNYLAAIDNDDAFLAEEGREILGRFAEIRNRNPTMAYREAVDVLREQLGGEIKTPLLDFFREGFKFARGQKRYSLIEGSDKIIISKQDWGA